MAYFFFKYAQAKWLCTLQVKPTVDIWNGEQFGERDIRDRNRRFDIVEIKRLRFGLSVYSLIKYISW